MSEQENVYVIWAEFDEEFTHFLNDKCKELEKYGIEPGVRPPHMTLTFVKNCDEEKLLQYTKSFIENKPVNPHVNSIGQFSGGFVFYGLKADKELLEFQAEFCKGIYEFGELAWDLYYPGNWAPHIALTGGLDKETAFKAFSIMQKGFSATNVFIKKVVVLRNGELLSDIYV